MTQGEGATTTTATSQQIPHSYCMHGPLADQHAPCTAGNTPPPGQLRSEGMSGWQDGDPGGGGFLDEEGGQQGGGFMGVAGCEECGCISFSQEWYETFGECRCWCLLGT